MVLKASLPFGVGYGKSFPDVVQGLENTIENLQSNDILAPSFKYKVALEKQVNFFIQFQYEQYWFIKTNLALGNHLSFLLLIEYYG